MRVRGFMSLHDSDIECLSDPYAPPSCVFLVRDYGSSLLPIASRGAPFVVGSPSAWAELGAYNLARAYRPEGVA